jgi:DNA replication protein DnaC
MCDECDKHLTTTVDSSKTIHRNVENRPQKREATKSELEEIFMSFFNEPTNATPSKDVSLSEMYDNFFPQSDTRQTRAMLQELDRLESNKKTNEYYASLKRDRENAKMWEDAFLAAANVKSTALKNAKQVLSDAFNNAFNNALNKRTLVVNLFAGPGAGKSTMAAGIFYELKNRGINCELTMEFAKDLTWEERHDTFKDQVYIFGKQYHRIFRLLDKVDVIITDSPLLLTPIYDAHNRKELKELAVAEHKKMNTYNVFLLRKKDFNPKGRVHNEQEAIALDKKIRDFLNVNEPRHVSIYGDERGKSQVVQAIVNILQNNKVI